MILADTSMWIRALRGDSPYIGEMDGLLAKRLIVGHPVVYGELVIGDSGGRRKTLDLYTRLNQTSVVPHDAVVALVRERRLSGRGIGWVDAHLLASALACRARLWTAGERLDALARELLVSYEFMRPS